MNIEYFIRNDFKEQGFLLVDVFLGDQYIIGRVKNFNKYPTFKTNFRHVHYRDEEEFVLIKYNKIHIPKKHLTKTILEYFINTFLIAHYMCCFNERSIKTDQNLFGKTPETIIYNIAKNELI